MEELKKVQHIFMVGTSQYFANNYVKGNDSLETFERLSEGSRSALPIEIFELDVILVPFHCFLGAVESRKCALPHIIPVTRMLLTLLRESLELIRTDRMRDLFRELHVRFLARLMTNNHRDAIAAYSLTFEGRQKLRVLESGYSPERPHDLSAESCPDLKSCVKGHYAYDDAMASAFAVAGNSNSMFPPQDSFDPGPPPWWVAHESYAPQTDGGEDNQVAQSYRDYLVTFHDMPADERMAFEPFRAVYETARPRIVDFARSLGLDFHHPKEIPFTLDKAAPESANSL
jgi:hypothetical protein